MEDTILGIDIGTSSIKCCLFTIQGKEIFSSSAQYGLLNPSPGVFEIDPLVLWDATVKAIRDINCQVLSGRKYRIISVGMCAMMIMPVLIGKDMKVLRPIIHWFDERLQKQYYKIKKLKKDKILSKFSGSSLTGEGTVNALDLIKETEKETYGKLEKLIMVKDFIRLKLTGKLYSDFGDASGSQLFDTRSWRWAHEAIEELGFNISFFPKLLKPYEIAGYITRQASEITGLSEGMPVAAGSGDGITTVFGLGTNRGGQTGMIVGSAGVFATASKEFPKDSGLRTYIFSHPFCDRWYSLQATASSGATLKWYLNSFLKNNELSFKDLDTEAAAVAAGADGLLFLPYILGSRNPHSNPRATGVFLGLRYKHERSHLTRAVFEGIAFELLSILKVQEEILSQNKLQITEIKVAGGIINSGVWMQIFADIFQKELIVTQAKELGALGSAIFASVAVGVYNNLDEACSHMISDIKTVKPNKEHGDIYKNKFNIFMDMYNTLENKFEFFSS